MHEEVFIPISFFATVFGIVYLVLSTRNKERMAMIEKGQNADLFQTKRSRSENTLKLGMLAVGVAAGLIMGEILSRHAQILQEETAFFACSFLFGGLALIVNFNIERRMRREEDQQQG